MENSIINILNDWSIQKNENEDFICIEKLDIRLLIDISIEYIKQSIETDSFISIEIPKWNIKSKELGNIRQICLDDIKVISIDIFNKIICGYNIDGLAYRLSVLYKDKLFFSRQHMETH